jgi:putative phosphoribosyl transferase
MKFADLFSAGRMLADTYPQLVMDCDLILAVANGGVPLGVELARTSRLPLDLITLRRLLAADRRGLPVTAANIGGTTVLDHESFPPAMSNEVRFSATKHYQWNDDDSSPLH